MLVRRETLEKIESGAVELIFRRWTRPTVKAGGSLRTSHGVLEIVSVDRVTEDELGEDDAIRAGLDDLESLLAFLRRRETGDIYRIEVGSLTPDPRVTLRSSDVFDDSELTAISERLDALDDRSQGGRWTHHYLRLIADEPNVLAEDLAGAVGVEKAVFKRRVRQLKELGLTISRSPGYELSPRGIEVVRRLDI